MYKEESYVENHVRTELSTNDNDSNDKVLADNEGGDEQVEQEDLCIDDEDMDTTITCSICLLGFDDGDRIGALQCQHMFHVDCLKLWLTRRNVCPLCQAPDIARLCKDGQMVMQMENKN